MTTVTQKTLTPEQAANLRKGETITLDNGDIGVIESVAKATIYVPAREQKQYVLTVRTVTGPYAGSCVDVTVQGTKELKKHGKLTKPQFAKARLHAWLKSFRKA
jgi:preprotein translocase subunit YajC